MIIDISDPGFDPKELLENLMEYRIKEEQPYGYSKATIAEWICWKYHKNIMIHYNEVAEATEQIWQVWKTCKLIKQDEQLPNFFTRNKK